MSKPTIALCIPTIRPERRDHVVGLGEVTHAALTLHLTDREPNWSWAERMRKFWLESGADFCLTLQDDSEVPDDFGDILRAQLAHLPPRAVLGLASVHPAQSEMFRQGHRWYRTRAWVVGWGWGMWRDDVEKFHAWCNANEGQALASTEDSLVNGWCAETARDVWHPVPATVDHDTSLASTYANDSHVHRRPFVTWRDVVSDLTRPEYWRPSGDPPLLPMPHPRHCWWCLKNPASVATVNGPALCRPCLVELVKKVVMQ